MGFAKNFAHPEMPSRYGTSKLSMRSGPDQPGAVLADKLASGEELVGHLPVSAARKEIQMTDDQLKSEMPFPTPRTGKQRSKDKSLNLENVDMRKDGVQGDVAVSKGRASTFVTKVPDSEFSN
jgi:hypothetical protein